MLVPVSVLLLGSDLVACGRWAHAEVEEYGKHSPIGVLTVGDVEFEEQSPDVGLDGPFAEDQVFGDAGVRHSLCHQPKHFVLAMGELGESV
ncbi:MAG: hypothetical protein K0R30_2841, partial [Ornithinibacter sp.]|nr:hypothetical protein [Ornithinibacter sp.]